MSSSSATNHQSGVDDDSGQPCGKCWLPLKRSQIDERIAEAVLHRVLASSLQKSLTAIKTALEKEQQ
jgi:hypothetical protein